MNNFVSAQRERIKEKFNIWIDNISSLKAKQFLAFQTVQKMCRGAALHTFLRFLPTKEPCQLRRVSLTEEGNTQDTPNKVKRRSHKTFVLEQWRRRWSMVSSFSRHKKHLFSKAHPLFCTLSKVRALPHVASHAKKLILGCTINGKLLSYFLFVTFFLIVFSSFPFLV